MAIIDRTNMYEMMEYWLSNIAPTYFDMEDLNLNRLGLFGYVNEVMAHSFESIVNENSILYNELFFKRAVLPNSIYSYASHYNVTNLTAKPAVMSFALGIDEKTLLENAIQDDNGDRYFIIDSDTEIIVEDSIPFMLDYDVKITIKQDEVGNYYYSAKYITTGLNNPVSVIKESSNPFIKLTKIKMESTYYIFVYVDAHQYKKIEKNKTIYSEDFLEYFSFDIDFETGENEQLADFTVFYKKPNVTEFSQIDKKLIDSAESEKPFCFYQFKDYNKVNISFSTITRFFRPEYNSELNFIFYSSLGAGGNFTYTGDNVAVNLKSDKYDYRSVIMIGKAMSDSVGGEDRLTYEEIKNQVSIKASTSGLIGTELDLNKYFESIQDISEILFVKKRDDILDRIYGAFLLMRDSKNNLIPTNTTSLDLYDSDFDLIEESTKRYVLKPGTRMVYKPNSKTLKVQRNNQGLTEPKFVYANPFTIVVNRQPFFVEYYLTSINKSYNPDFAEVNDDAFVNFITNSIEIERDSLHDEYFHFRFKTIPNMENINIDFANLTDEGKFESDNGKMKCVGVIYDHDTGEPSHYFNVDMVDYKLTNKTAFFEAKIKTDDYISTYAALRTTENLVEIENPNRVNPMIYASNLRVGICVFLQDDDYKDSIYHNIIPGLQGYTLSNVFKIDEDIDLINGLQQMMYSSVLYDTDENGEIFYHIKEVPVIRYDYIHIQEYAKEFISLFLSNYNLLKETINKITNAFNLSVKFYNTYGKSYYFYINEKKTNLLDRVNLSLHLRITLNPSKIMDNNLKEEIRNFIRDYVESVNDDINLYVSNLIKALEVNFRDINHMTFKYINDYGSEVQSIEKNFPTNDALGKNRLKDFIPEYLNINKKYDGYNNTSHDVIVEFI